MVPFPSWKLLEQDGQAWIPAFSQFSFLQRETSCFFHVADVCDACEAAARVALVKRVKGKKNVARIGKKTEASSSILSPNSSLDREQTLIRKTPTCSKLRMYCILGDLRCTASPNYSWTCANCWDEVFCPIWWSSRSSTLWIYFHQL